MGNQNKILGLILIFLGIIFLLDNLDVIGFNVLIIWPSFIILGGAGFILGYLIRHENYPMLMPGTILIIAGLIFLYCNVAGWHHMQVLWPLFLAAPGLGFILLYFLGKRDKGLLIPGGLLLLLGLLFLVRHLEYIRYWPVLLIVFGIILIFMRKPLMENKS